MDLVLTPEGRLTLNDARYAVSAALAGVGIARVAAEYAEPHIRAGRLIQLLESYRPALPAWHIYCPSRRHVPPALRAFLDFYRKTLER